MSELVHVPSILGVNVKYEKYVKSGGGSFGSTPKQYADGYALTKTANGMALAGENDPIDGWSKIVDTTNEKVGYYDGSEANEISGCQVTGSVPVGSKLIGSSTRGKAKAVATPAVGGTYSETEIETQLKIVLNAKWLTTTTVSDNKVTVKL